jgi:hypothetical protein
MMSSLARLEIDVLEEDQNPSGIAPMRTPSEDDMCSDSDSDSDGENEDTQ